MVHLIAAHISTENSLLNELCCNVVLWFQVMGNGYMSYSVTFSSIGVGLVYWKPH